MSASVLTGRHSTLIRLLSVLTTAGRVYQRSLRNHWALQQQDFLQAECFYQCQHNIHATIIIVILCHYGLASGNQTLFIVTTTITITIINIIIKTVIIFLPQPMKLASLMLPYKFDIIGYLNSYWQIWTKLCRKRTDLEAWVKEDGIKF